jgi:hypothetical protein
MQQRFPEGKEVTARVEQRFSAALELNHPAASAAELRLRKTARFIFMRWSLPKIGRKIIPLTGVVARRANLATPI